MKTKTIQIIKDWIQIFAFLIGGIWAVYTFVYKEIISPKNKYVSLTSQVLSSTMQCNNSKCGTVIKIMLENNNDKDLFLLNDITYVYGYKLSDKEYPKEQFNKYITNAINNNLSPKVKSRYSIVKSIDVIFCGSLFTGYNRIVSENTDSKEIIVHYPKGKYDYLIFISIIPKVIDTTNIFMKYQISHIGNKNIYKIRPCTIIDSDTIELSYKDPVHSHILKEKFYSQIYAQKIINLWE